jgi:hypothetical protein
MWSKLIRKCTIFEHQTFINAEYLSWSLLMKIGLTKIDTDIHLVTEEITDYGCMLMAADKKHV